ncbi:alpha/beta fold hydrolase [Gallaecimonas xiamenensis]|uniref:Alpha/beta hydrolase-like protein n=1 Tax=Gallaecimonas xiamenensis 3-C-1 TaxID=745411 RepID=K2JRC5_9GAMM|nr:alpha/beta fold hydrolase [Gallaecimonas xiamenensis]EKE72999.1 alpha/beta hydrolase-like protein [Gallaecimonas xiamenensis 3-C-1]
MESVSFYTADQYRLQGYRYPAQGPLQGRVIVAGATGVPQGFYRRFAQFASEQGFESLTFDYRGIGESKPPSLKDFEMDLLDWGKRDLAAAVDLMAKGDAPLFVIGHSYGGHAFGLLPNHHKVAGLYVFGTGAGWHGYMPRLEQLKVLTMWHLVLPVLTWWKGYCAWKVLGMGEDLPKNAFLQWRHWCRYPHYFFDDPAMAGIDQLYRSVQSPIVAANALDDLWAMPESRDAFIQHYSQAPITRVNLSPNALGGRIGHMGYFRKNAAPLWQASLDWFKAQAAKGEAA